MKQRSTSPKGQQQQQDGKRKTRMHQMEQMEAAARGTAPSMTLDMPQSSFADRNQMVADDFLREGGGGVPGGYSTDPTSSLVVPLSSKTSTATATATSTNFFSQRDKYEVDQSVNLMDASSKRYSSGTGGGGNKRASFVDIFIGGSGNTSGSGGTVTTSWRSSAPGKILIGCFFLLFMVLLTLSVQVLMTDNDAGDGGAKTFVDLVSGTESDTETEGSSTAAAAFKTNVKDEDRFKALKSVLLDQKASHENLLEDRKSSAFQALRWLTDDDAAQMSQEDPEMPSRFALATLYYATHGSSRATNTERQVMDEDEATSDADVPDWTRQDKWMSEASVCDWYGVDCGDTGEVVHLNMTSNLLSGTIPEELRSLTSMILLDLSKNEMSGTIPAQLFRLFQIKYFLLHENKLTGSIPHEVNKLESVFELYLSHNKLNGPIPAAIGSLENLRALYLGWNQLSGSIPDLSGLKDISE